MSHSELDILECEVKRALGSTAANKAIGGDGIPAELFKILKDDAKLLYNIVVVLPYTDMNEPLVKVN